MGTASKSLIVLISGKQGSGKSTLASGLRQASYRMYRMSFADPLYEVVAAASRICRDYGVAVPKEKDRDLIRLLAEDWGKRRFGKDVWARAALKTIEMMERYGHDLFIIDDLRFPEELNTFSDRNVLHIHLTCDEETRKQRAESWGDPEHVSETLCDSFIPAVTLNTSELNQEQVLELALRFVKERYADTITP